MARKSKAEGPEVSAEVSNAASADTAPTEQQAPARSARGGAPRGNTNALKHGGWSKRMQAFRKATGNLRDGARRAGEREAREILKRAGLEEDPLARLVARQLARLEAVILRYEHHHATRGHFNRNGEVKASVTQEVGVIGKLLDEARRLLEQMKPAAKVGDVVYVASFGDPEVDGAPASAGSLAGLALADEAMALEDGPIAPTPSAHHARGADRPAHASLTREEAPPVDLRELVQEPEADKSLPDGARGFISDRFNGESAPHPRGCLCARCRWNRCDDIE